MIMTMMNDERVIAHCLLALQFTLGIRLYEPLLLSKTSGSWTIFYSNKIKNYIFNSLKFLVHVRPFNGKDTIFRHVTIVTVLSQYCFKTNSHKDVYSILQYVIFYSISVYMFQRLYPNKSSQTEFPHLSCNIYICNGKTKGT